jgi:hypothetical protein
LDCVKETTDNILYRCEDRNKLPLAIDYRCGDEKITLELG